MAADGTQQTGNDPSGGHTAQRASRSVGNAENPRRSVSSMVRFTPDEFALIAQRARDCGRAPARFIREAALGAVPRERRSAASAELLRQLGRIGNNLNQLAARAHSGAPLPGSALETALGELLEAVRRIELEAGDGASGAPTRVR
jgi:hypothetical protein